MKITRSNELKEFIKQDITLPPIILKNYRVYDILFCIRKSVLERINGFDEVNDDTVNRFAIGHAAEDFFYYTIAQRMFAIKNPVIRYISRDGIIMFGSPDIMTINPDRIYEVKTTRSLKETTEDNHYVEQLLMYMTIMKVIYGHEFEGRLVVSHLNGDLEELVITDVNDSDYEKMKRLMDERLKILDEHIKKRKPPDIKPFRPFMCKYCPFREDCPFST